MAVWSLSRARRVLVALAVAGALLLMPVASSAKPGPFPGIPHLDPTPGFGDPPSDRNLFSWLNAPYNGLAGSNKSLQWLRLPLGALATNIELINCTPDVCAGYDPAVVGVDEPYSTFSAFPIAAFLVSPADSPEPYGDSQVATARSLAFGSIPIEVELQFSQTRDQDGLPVPLSAMLSEYVRLNANGTETELAVRAGKLEGAVAIRVVGLRLDGVETGVSRTCATTPTRLDLSSPPITLPLTALESFDPRQTARGLSGGSFHGVVDIPPFTGCTTPAGDDLSSVLTSTISGTGNPVSVQYGTPGCGTSSGSYDPTPPGADTPAKAGCLQYQLAADQNPDLWAIPLPWDIPDYAPGATAP